jgi:predicted RNA-binding protein with PIN domain
MRYLIDGYNLLHAIGLLGGQVGPQRLQTARLALLSQLHGWLGAETAGVTVVFDAARAAPGAVPEDHYQGIHIWYALDGQADDLIEELIQNDAAPQQLTVVSDDHRVQNAARRRRCPVLGCMDYLDALDQRRQQPRTLPADGHAKPEGVSAEETQHWLREFADLVNDPKLREALGPDFRDDKKQN